MLKIFDIVDYEELICPKHHINLNYKKENNQLVLKCEWCNYTLIPLTHELKMEIGL